MFNEFPPVDTEQWEKVIKDDLKGADYEKKLIWKTDEGIRVRPYYRLEDLEKLAYLNINPGEFPYVRGNKTKNNNWEIRQDIKVVKIEQANHEALDALKNGATSIGFITGDKIKKASEFSKLIKGIDIGCINFNLTGDNASELINFVIEEAEKATYDKSIMDGCLEFDPLGKFSLSGNWISGEEADFAAAKLIIKTAKANIPKYRVIAVNGCMFQESGASIVQTLGYTLALANEYLVRLTDLGLSIDEIAQRIQFNFSTGSNYFMEISKIRSFRLLWSKLVEAYNPKSENTAKAYIHSTTSMQNMSVLDSHVNMLRAATESMSAVIGGADSISVKPFDSIFKKDNSFSNRIARNIQIILKEEAYFDRIVDPAAGSYYIENLTDSIAAGAWKIFLDVEKEGGYSKSFIKGTIQKEIETAAAKHLNDIATRRKVLLGVNQYPGVNEKISDNIDFNIFEEPQKMAIAPLDKPLKAFRGAKDFENLRLETEKSGKRPKVFMLTIGNMAMRLARSQFSGNFFACAGFEIIDNNGFKTVDEGVKAALVAKADIVILCSSDEEYETLALQTLEVLDGKAIFVVAGNPPCRPGLEARGITNFISIYSNVIETLEYYQKNLKIY